jgi:hypothetical protein
LVIERAMRALDYLRRAIVAADARDQLIVRLARILRDENVTRAPQVPRRLAQRSAREKEFVPEWRLSIDQHDVEPMFKVEILQTIIEQEGVDPPVINRVTPAFDAVLVDEDDHVFQIMREHERFVPGGERIEQQRFSIGNNPRRINRSAKQAINPTSLRRFRLTLVTAAEDSDPAAADLQRASKFFDHRSFSGTADREVTNADDETTECALTENAFPIQIKPELDDAFVEKGKRVKHSAQDRGAKSATATEDNVDAELL